MKKKLLSMLLASSMVVGLAACGSSAASTDSSAATDTAAPATEAAADAGDAAAEETATSSDTSTLYINLASEPDFLDPALNSSVDGACLAIAAFSGILEYDEAGELVPAVAASMPEVSDDETVYTIALKETKWSNGDDLTANDFVYSWNRAIAEETAADYAYMFDVIEHNADGTLAVEATDDYTLQITLDGPCPYFNQLLAFPAYFPVHEASVEAADTTTPGTWAQEAGFVCNGPYTLTAWSHGESMTYEKNANYYDADSVSIEKLQFMLSADDTAIYAAYNSGDLDFIDSVPNDEIQSLLDNPEFHIIDNMGTYYAAFNVESDLFDGMTEEQAADFRHAICLLIDRQYIVDTVGQTGQQVADSYIPAGMSDGNGGIFKTVSTSYYDATTTDIEQAVSLLESAGFTMTDNGDGTYSIDPAVTLPYILNESSGHQKVAESIQSDLAMVGIDMTIETQDWNVFLENRKQGNYSFAREGWLADFDDPINMLEMFTTDSGNNDPQFGRGDAISNWGEYDALINEIRTTTDFAGRVDLMHQAEDMLMSTYGVIPIYYYNDVFMQKSNVDGIYANAYGFKYFHHATKS